MQVGGDVVPNRKLLVRCSGDGGNEKNLTSLMNFGWNVDHTYSLPHRSNVETFNQQGDVERVTWNEVESKVRPDICQQYVQEVTQKGNHENIGTTEIDAIDKPSNILYSRNCGDGFLGSRRPFSIKGRLDIWAEFILYSTLVVPGVKNRFNPYLADVQDVSTFLSSYRHLFDWDSFTEATYLETMANRFPGFTMGIDVAAVQKDIIMKIGNSIVVTGCVAPHQVTWNKFVEFCSKKDSNIDPFLADPMLVRDFLISKLKGKELREIPRSDFFKPSENFYTDNLFRICSELDWYLKTSLCHKPLLKNLEMTDLVTAARNRDEGVVTDKLAVKLTPDYHFCKYSLAGVTYAFWISKLTSDLLADVKSGAIELEVAAKELGITREMLNARLRKSDIDLEGTLSLRQYVEQNFGTKDSFWKEESINKLLVEVYTNSASVDYVAVKLGVSRSLVIEKCAGISGKIDVQRKKSHVTTKKVKSDLERQIESTEEMLDSLSEYEKMRLNNMKERQRMVEMLNLGEEKLTHKLRKGRVEGIKKGKIDKAVVQPRKPSARIKRLGETKKFSSKTEIVHTQRSGVVRRQISPRWFAQWIPRSRTKFLSLPVPPVELKTTELLEMSQEFHTSVTMTESIASEVKTLAVEMKWEDKVSFDKMDVEHDCIVSNKRLTSIDSFHDFISFGTSTGGVGIFLAGRSVTFQPHNKAVSRIIFRGGHSSLNVLSSALDGAVRLTDLEKQVVCMKYSWDQGSNTKHKVYWMEGETNNSSLLLHCGKDVKRLDIRERKAYSLINLSEMTDDGLEKMGTNISIHPMQATMATTCTIEGVKIWDLRNPSTHIELIRQGVSTNAQSNQTACGASWSSTGQFLMVANRLTVDRSKYSLTVSNIPTVYAENNFSNPHLSWSHPMVVSYSPMYGVNWCPWDHDPTFLTSAKLPTGPKSKGGLEPKYQIVAVDAASGKVAGKLYKELDNTCYLVHCHNTRPEVVVGNSRGDGVLAVYKAY